MYDFQPIRHNDGIATWLIAEYRMFLIQKYPLGFYVWGYAPYNPSTANQLKCSSLCSIISLDSWFRLVIPYSQLTLALWNNNPDIYVRQYSLFYTNIAQLFSFSPLLLYIFTNKELIPVFIFCNYLISIFL